MNRNSLQLNSAGRILNTILNIGNLVDTSKSNGQHLFYALCVSFIRHNINAHNALNTLIVTFDKIIQAEQTFFNKSRVLNYLMAYLANNSDGDNLQCRINTQCLDYLMSKYLD